ncbi:hypothetical protein [Nocardioides sp. B-3]|uniref:hypothetical protein n=1 Tax=Nocardioides sp. B-3 TaxID=2895565 RepID=UPI0021535E3E|nr:hypothetical protein [Nocardioides sp. B-3]UUZ61191.1 hypothetical protein LP418_11575 [Nocardioides sp. B-3]
MPDSDDWLHRLKVVGIDLRDPTRVISLADDVAAAGTLDILINNACQTVRRTPGAYAPLVDAELAPLPTDRELPEMVTFDEISSAHPAAIAGALSDTAVAHHPGESPEAALAAHNAASLTALALTAGHASLDAHIAGTAVDAGGLLPDVQLNNSPDADGRRGEPARAARGAAVQLDRALPAGVATATGPGRGCSRCVVRTRVRRERVGDGGTVRWPPLQGRGAPCTPTWPRPRSTC